MTLDEVREKALTEILEFKGTNVSGPKGFGLRGWCEHHNVNSGHASEFLNGKRNAPKDLLDALNLEWKIMPK